MKKRIVSIVCVVVMLIAVLTVTACSGSKKTTVYLLNWGEYLDPELLQEFNEAQDDIVIKQTTSTSNEEMYTICATDGSGIDMVIPSDYMIERMISENLLAEIDIAQIPNYKYVADFAKTCSFDAGGRYSVPYMLGTLGIVYNKTMVDDEVKSWDILWDEKYSKKIMMYDSIRDSLAVSLSRLGYDINSTDPAELEEAGQALIDQKPLVLAYGTDDIKDSMISGSAALAMDYSGAAMAAAMENPDVSFVVPEENGNIFVDSIVVMKNTENMEACCRFINFLCDPEICARNSEYIGYSVPSDEAAALVDEELSGIPGYIVDDETASRLTYFKDLGEALELYNDVWMKVKTAGN